MEAAAERAHVMFVDDEKRVLTSMRALFRRDYHVHLANSGNEALELLKEHDMDVIVSDQRMPGMTGVDVLRECKERAPRAMRILLTGYADKDAIEASINEGEVFRYLTKPCAREELKEIVALAVSAANLGTEPANDAAADPEGELTPTVDAETGVAAAPTPTRDAGPAAGATPAPAATSGATAAQAAAVELMVLSSDEDFTSSLQDALSNYRVHAVKDVEQALEVLDENTVGVVITDMAVNADEVQVLTAQLKHSVPELVAIVASDHSDAHRLIELINSGQVFRFLLKPIKPKQTAIWIDSAVSKHLQLVRDPNLVKRHVVAQPSPSLLEMGDKLVRNIAGRMFALRKRRGE